MCCHTNLQLNCGCQETIRTTWWVAKQSLLSLSLGQALISFITYCKFSKQQKVSSQNTAITFPRLLWKACISIYPCTLHFNLDSLDAIKAIVIGWRIVVIRKGRTACYWSSHAFVLFLHCQPVPFPQDALGDKILVHLITFINDEPQASKHARQDTN